MTGDGNESRVPDFSQAVYTAVKRALKGRSTLTTSQWDNIAEYVNAEYDPLKRPDVLGYLILGSYRSGYRQRLRATQHEIEKSQTSTYPVVLGDTPDIQGIPKELNFFLRFHLLATGADEILGVYEKDSGGESPELGKVTATYFTETRVLPRGYTGLVADTLDSPTAVKEAAAEIYLADGPTDEQKRAELQGLLENARQNGVEISAEEIVAHLKQRDVASPGYSWVHLCEFRRLEREGRCHPWQLNQELRDIARNLPAQHPPDA